MDEKIEVVARALCRFDGKDPDQVTRLPGGRMGFQATIGAAPANGPALWEAYRAEAERFVVAADALAPLLQPAPPKRW